MFLRGDTGIEGLGFLHFSFSGFLFSEYRCYVPDLTSGWAIGTPRYSTRQVLG